MTEKTPPKAKTGQNSKPVRPAAQARGLGRGLSSLLGDDGAAAAAGITAPNTDKTSPNGASLSGLSEIPVEWINTGPWQPRRIFDQESLAELANSIRQKGIVQPVLVRPNPRRAARFELIAGERRWRAAQLAQLYVIPAIVRDFSDTEAYEIALIENIQRADLSAIEEAQGYQKLLEHHNYTQEQLSEIIGKSRSHIANFLRLLALPPKVQDMVVAGTLTMGQVRPIINHDDCLALAMHIARKGLSARQAEILAKKSSITKSGTSKSGTSKSGTSNTQDVSPDIKALQDRAAAKLGLAVKIDWDSAKDKGVLQLKCESLEQMDEILAKLGIA